MYLASGINIYSSANASGVRSVKRWVYLHQRRRFRLLLDYSTPGDVEGSLFVGENKYANLAVRGLNTTHVNRRFMKVFLDVKDLDNFRIKGKTPCVV